MTTPETTTETPQETPSAPPAPEEAAPAPTATPDREAARYRLRLRETEAERDALAERVTTYQRWDAERLAGASLSRPADVWLDGVAIETLLDDHGDVDAALVDAAVRAVLVGRPQLAPHVADHGGGRRGGLDAASASWSDLIGGRSR